MEFDRSVGALDGNEWVATAGAYSMRLTVPGGEVAVSAITGVGVRPDFRRQGLLREMMDWLFDDARKHEEPVAVLLASEAAIYQRFGFGQASMASSFSFDPTSTTFRRPVDLGPGARVRLVDPSEALPVFSRIYEQVRPRTPGALDRVDARWRDWLLPDPEWLRHGDGVRLRALLEVDGEPRGFAIYRIQQGWSATGPSESLSVQEVIALDPDAEQVLWEWLLSMDLVRTITGRRAPVPHPLQHMLLEPRRLGLTVTDGLWLRILDLPAALEARGYVGSGIAGARRRGRDVRGQCRPVGVGRRGRSRDGHPFRLGARSRARHRGAGCGISGRLPVRRSGGHRAGARMPGRRARTRRRAVHAVAVTLERDAVLGGSIWISNWSPSEWLTGSRGYRGDGRTYPRCLGALTIELVELRQQDIASRREPPAGAQTAVNAARQHRAWPWPSQLAPSSQAVSTPPSKNPFEVAPARRNAPVEEDSARRAWKMDFKRDKVGVEVSFNHAEATRRQFTKLSIAGES